MSTNYENGLFQLSWYLDAVSPGWNALISDNYNQTFPLTEIKKGGAVQMFQPIFTREFEFNGSFNELFEYLKTNYKFIQFRSSKKNQNTSSILREHQLLHLNENTKANYSTNAKRLIKKSNQLVEYKTLFDLNPFIDIVNKTLVDKIAEFTPENIEKLKRLMTNAIQNKMGECIGVFQNDKLVGAGFFFHYKNRITYLKGAAFDEAKKNGAMFGLINFAIEKYSKDYTVFDFGGSDIKNVAQFYKKFGALSQQYYNYEINQLPFYYKWAKKWLKK